LIYEWRLGDEAHLLVVTTTTLYKYNSSTDTFDVLLSSIGGSDSNIPQAVDFYGRLIIANGGSSLIRYNGTTASFITESPSGATTVVALGGRVMVGGFAANPSKVKWSDDLDETNWTTGNAGEATLARTDDRIRRLILWRSQALIIRERSLWVASVLDRAPLYAFESLAEGVGSLLPGTAQATPMGVVFATLDNIYVVRGAVPEPAGISVQEFLRTVSAEHASKSISAVDLTHGRMYIGLPTGLDTKPQDLLVYNYVEGNFSYWRRVGLTALGVTYSGKATLWSAMTRAWSAYQIPWASLSGREAEGVPLFAVNGVIYKSVGERNDSGAAIPMVFRTPVVTTGGGAVDPTPSIVEAVEIDGEPDVELDVSLGRGKSPSGVSFPETRRVTLQSGRALAWFSAREAQYWQVDIRNYDVNIAPRIDRVVLWYRKREGQSVMA
jgi:hypothetical protein